MAHPAISCTVRFANDSQGAWATRADSGYALANITFWINPQGQLEITESGNGNGNGNGNGKLEKVVRCSTGMYSFAAADSDDPRGSHY